MKEDIEFVQNKLKQGWNDIEQSSGIRKYLNNFSSYKNMIKDIFIKKPNYIEEAKKGASVGFGGLAGISAFNSIFPGKKELSPKKKLSPENKSSPYTTEEINELRDKYKFKNEDQFVALASIAMFALIGRYIYKKYQSRKKKHRKIKKSLKGGKKKL